MPSLSLSLSLSPIYIYIYIVRYKTEKIIFNIFLTIYSYYLTQSVEFGIDWNLFFFSQNQCVFHVILKTDEFYIRLDQNLRHLESLREKSIKKLLKITVVSNKIYLRERLLCVCACVCLQIFTWIYKYTHTHRYIYIYKQLLLKTMELYYFLFCFFKTPCFFSRVGI